MKYIYVLLLIVFIASCRCSSEPQDQANTPVDTLMVGTKKILLYPIAKSDFEAVKYDGINGIDTIPLDTSKIRIVKDTITIHCENGKVVKLINDTIESDAMVGYEYLYSIKSCNSAFFRGIYYEWTAVTMVSLISGRRTEIVDVPNFSPTGKFMISSYSDLVSGEMPNGIELYKADNDVIKTVFACELEDWGPEEIRWQSDSVIFIKRLHLDDKYKESYDYVKANLVVRK